MAEAPEKARITAFEREDQAQKRFAEQPRLDQVFEQRRAQAAPRQDVEFEIPPVQKPAAPRLVLVKGPQRAAAGIVPSDLNIVMEANSNEAIRAAVGRGAGMAFQSRLAVRADIEAGRLVAIKLRGLRILRQLYAIHSKRRAPTAAMRAFLDYLEPSKPRKK